MTTSPTEQHAPSGGGGSSAAARFIPDWIGGYRREWLSHDLVAGIVIWSVVVPQAVAYAQIAGLPPQAGLIAAPGAMLGYALVGRSHTLVVSATTATSAVSLATVGPIANGDVKKFAELSAAFALVTAVVLIAAGFVKIGGIADLVSKPVMTGFLFGLGLTITVDQLPKLLGVSNGSGNFFPRLWDLLHKLDSINWWTFVIGAGSVVALVLFKRLAPSLPGTLIVLAGAIVVSAALGLSGHGVDVVGRLPTAYPEPGWPSVSVDDLVKMLPAAFGILLLTTEAVGVARTIATYDGYAIDPNRELIAIGSANVLAGFSQGGFVQSGGASQTMAAENAGGKSQLSTVFAAALIVLTGAFFTGLFRDLPQATLGAIVIVAISQFFRVDELRRFARLRTSAPVLALLALAGVLVFGVLPGLLIAAGVSLVVVVQRLSRPAVSLLARDPTSGAWGARERHPGWTFDAETLVARVDGPLFYANAVSVKDRLVTQIQLDRPKAVVLDLGMSRDLDVATLDTLRELDDALAKEQIELVLANVGVRAAEMLARAGLELRIAPTVDSAVS